MLASACDDALTTGRDLQELAAPTGARRMGANLHTNGGLLLRDLRLPDYRDYAVAVEEPGGSMAEATRIQGEFLRDVMKLNLEAANFRIFSPDENNSNRWQAILEVTDRWPGQSDIPRRIRPFDACQLYIGPDLVMTGFVDATPIRYDGKSVTVGVRGRSKTADLVDCCPIESGRATGAGKRTEWPDVIGPDGKKPNVITPPLNRRTSGAISRWKSSPPPWPRPMACA